MKKIARLRVKKLLEKYPVYPEIDLEYLERCFRLAYVEEEDC